MIAAADEFLIGLAHPDATNLRVSGKNACVRDRALAVLTGAASVIAKHPAEKKHLCALGSAAAKTLEDAHETSDAVAKDALSSLGKACM